MVTLAVLEVRARAQRAPHEDRIDYTLLRTVSYRSIRPIRGAPAGGGRHRGRRSITWMTVNEWNRWLPRG